MSPAEYQRHKTRQHVVIALCLALFTGGSVFYCQRDLGAAELIELEEEMR
jgi:hypothetical protein